MDEDRGTRAESEKKRRKLRKGTTSCWECKIRKTRCSFEGSLTDADSICVGCQRRGSKCVSQEFEVPASVTGAKRSRQAVEESPRMPISGDAQNSINFPTPMNGILTPKSADLDSPRLPAFQKPSEVDTVVNRETGYAKLSQELYASLPSREDIESICIVRDQPSILCHEVLTVPYSAVDQKGLRSSTSLLDIPGANTHPVLIARHMLYLATFLQHLHPDIHEDIKGLSEPPRIMMKRLADTAIDLVTTNDKLLSSIEALECIMLESLYQATGGNLRQSLVAIRRAMVIAQLMGLHRSGGEVHYKVLDPKTKTYPHFIWFRIIFYERQYCLMLGLPQGSLDCSMASDAMLANDTPMGRLERIHCVLASDLLKRNESSPSSNDFLITQELDMRLQKAARIMPSKWWLTPNLASVLNDSKALFLDMGRLQDQLFHYNLLNQLHLPYMLRSSDDHKYDYSRITCVNASREILSRFIMFRSFNRNAFCCRLVDFFALMAALTLLLVHLDSHRSSKANNLLAHQSLSDRAMIEQAQENMEEVSRLNGDALSTRSANLLGRLLIIEAEAAAGNIGSADSVKVHTVDTETGQSDDHDDNTSVRVYIPYFGTIKIASEGEMLKLQPLADSITTASRLEVTNSEVLSGFSGPNVASELEETNCNWRENHSVMPIGEYAAVQPQSGEFSMAPTSDINISAQVEDFVPSGSNLESDNLLQQYEYPPFTAGVDDWAFQGVDMAFFDNLMRGTGEDGDGVTEGSAWQNGTYVG